MPELFLVYRDEYNTERRVAVSGERFVIGRHSMNDLHIPDPRLSREHLRIERFGSTFSAADLGSSNGTTLNGYALSGTRELADGDKLDLGGGVQISVEIPAENAPPKKDEPVERMSTAAPANSSATTASETGGHSIPTIVFLALPAIALLCVLVFGTALYFMSGSGTDLTRVENSNENDEYYDDGGGSGPTPEPSSTPSRPSDISSVNSGGNSNVDAPPATPISEFATVEEHGSAFMRAIAQNEPRAFLTGEHAKAVGRKVKQISSSSAIVANIESARKNSARIKELAGAKNLRPQFLAAAAIARLGDRSGDVGQTAAKMAEVFGVLNLQIGSERADDAVLMVAAYDQGLAGDTMRLRNILQKLADEASESSRTVRTIWYVKQAGKLTDAEYESALRFLAVGTIMQNPAAFNVKTEALVF